MATTILRSTTSVRLRFLLDATGLTSSSAGLIISTICDNEATATAYTQAAGNIETISAIGTYAAPSSGKIRFAEVDATNHPGLYEIQIADARLNVTNSRTLVITCSGAGLPATGIHYEVDLEGARNVRAIEANAINAAAIASDAITDAKIANNAFTSGKFASGAFDSVWSVSARTVTGGSVDTVTSVIDAVVASTVNDKTGFSLDSNGLNGVTLPANIITASSIASNAITADKIADNALTSSKFAAGAFDAVWTVASRTLSAFGFSVTVGTNNDKTGYSLTQTFPTNFATLGINSSGHVSRVTLVDTTTTNTDMRGTDNALLASGYTAPPTPNQIMGGLVTGSQPAGSLARFVRDIKNGDLLFEGQIVSATTDKAILDAGATTVCVGQAISIGEEGDAERQTRFVTAFDPATKEITLDRPWCVVPSNGADYQVKTLRNPLVGDRTKVLTGGFNEAIADTFDVLDTLTEDSSGLRYTAKALEQAPAGGGGGGATIIVQPIVGEVPERMNGLTIRTFNGENFTAIVGGVDNLGNLIDWTQISNIEFVVDDQAGNDLATIADANITKEETFFSVTIPAAANVVPTGRNSIAYRWSVRDATSKVVILQGQVIVSRTALID